MFGGERKKTTSTDPNVIRFSRGDHVLAARCAVAEGRAEFSLHGDCHVPIQPLKSFVFLLRANK